MPELLRLVSTKVRSKPGKLLITSMVIFLVTGAGRVWGLDQLLLQRLKSWRLRVLM